MMDTSTELGDQSFSSLLNQMSPSCPMPKRPVDAETDIVNENKPVMPASDLGAVIYERESDAYAANQAGSVTARKKW